MTLRKVPLYCLVPMTLRKVSRSVLFGITDLEEGVSVLWVLGIGEQFDVVVGHTVEQLVLVVSGGLPSLQKHPPECVLPHTHKQYAISVSVM